MKTNPLKVCNLGFRSQRIRLTIDIRFDFAEVSAVLIKYLRMLKEGKEEEVKAELHTMVPCEMWIVSGAKIKYQPIDDSGSESEEDTNDPEDMDVEPASAMDVGSEQVNPSTCGSSTKFIEEEAIDPGWTQVRGRRRR